MNYVHHLRNLGCTSLIRGILPYLQIILASLENDSETRLHSYGWLIAHSTRRSYYAKYSSWLIEWLNESLNGSKAVVRQQNVWLSSCTMFLPLLGLLAAKLYSACSQLLHQLNIKNDRHQTQRTMSIFLIHIQVFKRYSFCITSQHAAAARISHVCIFLKLPKNAELMFTTFIHPGSCRVYATDSSEAYIVVEISIIGMNKTIIQWWML